MQHFAILNSPDLSVQVVNSVGKYRMLIAEGLFRKDDDFSAIMKSIESIDARGNANQCDSQSGSQSVPNEVHDVDPGSSWNKTTQGVLYSDLIALLRGIFE